MDGINDILSDLDTYDGALEEDPVGQKASEGDELGAVNRIGGDESRENRSQK